ncbi:MAG: hypothetical protein M1415_03215 [Firmicutes bacterium]|jgi:hypothetical protein|nr:hypothetical protein [Bacillota bacterium]MCL5064524.1 hypothetical protein [Bacillota bacterium]
MIVRIMADGQYDLSEESYDRLQVIDEHLLAALEADDGGAFHRLFHDALKIVRGGQRLDEAVLQPSDLVLPPEDTTIDEARRLLASDSL